MERFTIDTEALSARKDVREKADTREIFERINKGSMPAIVSGPLADFVMVGVFL